MILPTGTIATLNPLRYRGYVYDPETGLYYLQSRYYNPQWGRFINADGLVSTGQGLLGYNMFAYCNNNPVGFKDFNGNVPMSTYDSPAAWFGAQLGEWISTILRTDRNERDSAGNLTTNAKIKRAGELAVNCVDASVGIGLGLYGEGNIGDVVGLGGGINHNLVEFKLNEGEFSIEQSYFMGIEGSVLFIDVLQDANESGSRKLDFSSPMPKYVIDGYNTNWTIFSAGAYLFAGGSVYLGFDMIYFCENIYSCFYD